MNSFFLTVFLIFIFQILNAKPAIIAVETPFPGSILYVPHDGKPHPGIIVLHGSEGGTLPYFHLDAQMYAANGYAALAFCWYNCRKNPITSPYSPLKNIELMKTVEAISWLKNSNYVGDKKVGLHGVSRGAEQAMILASLDESRRLLSAISAHTPADRIVSGYNWSSMDKRCWICAKLDLSCFNNTHDVAQWAWEQMKWNPSCGEFPEFPDQMNAWLLNGVPLQKGAVIEVEKFGKPIFLSVGDKDELWDYQQTVRIYERLQKFEQPSELLLIPGEGHNFNLKNENIRIERVLRFFELNLKEINESIGQQSFSTATERDKSIQKHI